MRKLRLVSAVKGFRALLITYFVNYLGDEFGALALAYIVYAQTRSALVTALLFVGRWVVPGFVGPAIVARTEKFGARQVLTRLYLVEAILFGVLVVGVRTGAPTAAIILVATLDGVLALAGRSFSRAASATVLVEAGLLEEGMSALNVVFAVVAVGAPILAGAVVALESETLPLSIDCVSFLAAALIVWRARD